MPDAVLVEGVRDEAATSVESAEEALHQRCCTLLAGRSMEPCSQGCLLRGMGLSLCLNLSVHTLPVRARWANCAGIHPVCANVHRADWRRSQPAVGSGQALLPSPERACLVECRSRRHAKHVCSTVACALPNKYGV